MKQSTGSSDPRLQQFCELLLRWTGKINLISPHDQDHIWQRHIADSLQLVPLLPSGLQRGIDLGTGAGFPGLILAIATAVPFDLIEVDRRKAAFLQEAIRLTRAPATVHCVRIEAAQIKPARVVTARALAPLPRLLPLAARLLSEDGRLLLLKGERVDAELTGAALEWHMQVRRYQSATHASASIIEITGLRRVRSSNDH